MVPHFFSSLGCAGWRVADVHDAKRTESGGVSPSLLRPQATSSGAEIPRGSECVATQKNINYSEELDR